MGFLDKIKNVTDVVSKAGSEYVDSAQKTAQEKLSSLNVTTAKYAESLKNTVGNIKNKISETYDSSKDSISGAVDKCYAELDEFASNRIKSCLEKLDIEDIIQKVDEYQKKEGKDMSVLLDFLNRLKTIRDGE